MRKHFLGMYARIGSASAGERYWQAQNSMERLAKHFLYRKGIGLYLPTVIGCTVVGKLNKIPQVEKLNFCARKCTKDFRSTGQ